MTGAEFTVGMGVVMGFILMAGVLFSTEWIPNEMTALAIAVLLALFEPWTQLSPVEAISGFASPATVTVLAMSIVSEAVRRTGIVNRVGRAILPFAERSERHLLGTTLMLGGIPAGFVNNTPVVAVLIPLIRDLAKKCRVSPSRLLIPLSYASMMGGMLTVIGTSTTILASDLSRILLDHPIAMFEFTPLGVLVLIAGSIYLSTVGQSLIPERIRPDRDLTQQYRMGEYLHRVRVSEESPVIGQTVEDLERLIDLDLDILQILRDGDVYMGPTTDQRIEKWDRLLLRCHPDTMDQLLEELQFRELPGVEATDNTLVRRGHTLVETTVSPDSNLAGETLVSSRFRNRFNGTVLAIKRGDQLIRDHFLTIPLQRGDSLLLLTPRENRHVLDESPELNLSHTSPLEEVRSLFGELPADQRRMLDRRTILALGILASVVLVPALGLYPIYLTALAGVVMSVATNCVSSSDAYDAVPWNVIFLLAGVIPLGIAMQKTGTASYLAARLLEVSEGLPPYVILALFYVVTSLLANVISTATSAILMIPVSVQAAQQIGADPFAFLLGVTFAANTAFMTPVGYQTNLLVSTPGGYRFSDFMRVGAPLQLLLAGVTTAGIVLIWGL